MSTQAFFISGDRQYYLKAGSTTGLFLKKINLVEPTITGTQTVNGDQRVNGNLYVSNIDINNIDYCLFSGLTVLIKSGDIVSDSQIFASNLVYNTGTQSISGNKNFIDTTYFKTYVNLSGTGIISTVASYTPIQSNPFSVVGSGDTYIQTNIINKATGTAASADLVLTSNLGSDTVSYIDLGINNSGYNQADYDIGSSGDGYLYINGGNLTIGTQSTGKVIKFHVDGTTSNKEVIQINSSGLNAVSGNLRVNNTPVALSGDRLVFINLNNNSDSYISNSHNFFGQVAIGYKSFAQGRQFQILQDLVVKRATWTHLTATTIGNPNLAASGFFFTTGATNNQMILVADAILPSGSDTNSCFNYSKIFDPPIVIKSGDFIVASIYNAGGYLTLPAGTRNSLNLYCYY